MTMNTEGERKAFQESERNRELLDRLIAAADGLERGSTLEHSLIEEATGLTRSPEERDLYYYIVDRWRTFMRKTHGIETSPIAGVGWELHTKKGHYFEHAARRDRKADRQHFFNQRAMKAIPDEHLSQTLRQIKHAKLKMVAERRRDLRQNQEVGEVMNRRQQRLPIRPLPFADDQPQVPA